MREKREKESLMKMVAMLSPILRDAVKRFTRMGNHIYILAIYRFLFFSSGVFWFHLSTKNLKNSVNNTPNRCYRFNRCLPELDVGLA